jgi:hypothetical protein
VEHWLWRVGGEGGGGRWGEGGFTSNKTSDLEMKHLFSRTGFRVLAIKHLTLV